MFNAIVTTERCRRRFAHVVARFQAAMKMQAREQDACAARVATATAAAAATAVAVLAFDQTRTTTHIHSHKPLTPSSLMRAAPAALTKKYQRY